MANKDAGVCFLSLWEFPREENGESKLKGSITGSRLESAQGAFGIFGEGVGFGLVVFGRGGLTNPAEKIDMKLTVEDNVFFGNGIGVGIVALGPPDEDVAKGKIKVSLDGNQYVDNAIDAEARFLSLFGPSVYTKNTEIKVHDDDDVFGPADVGPPSRNNKYQLK